MKIGKLKEKLRDIKPFLTYTFNGVDNCLVDDNGLPLSVSVTPPSISFVVESNQITTLLLRYSETFKEQIEKAKNKELDEAGKTKLARKVMSEISGKVLGDPEQQAKQVGMITRLGKEFLIAKSIDAWYDDENDSVKCRFTDDKREADLFNAKEDKDDEILIYVETLTDMELLKIGMELISALPTDDMPNIPIEDITIAEDGTAEKGVISSVPAEPITRFPRNLRSHTVEDVPRTSGGEVGDSGANDTARG